MSDDKEAAFIVDDVIQLAEAVLSNWYYNNPNGADRGDYCWRRQYLRNGLIFNEDHDPSCPVIIADAVLTGYK
jgi:hypothetical protein